MTVLKASRLFLIVFQCLNVQHSTDQPQQVTSDVSACAATPGFMRSDAGAGACERQLELRGRDAHRCSIEPHVVQAHARHRPGVIRERLSAPALRDGSDCTIPWLRKQTTISRRFEATNDRCPFEAALAEALCRTSATGRNRLFVACRVACSWPAANSRVHTGETCSEKSTIRCSRLRLREALVHAEFQRNPAFLRIGSF
jgi:hypothetical protein